MPDVAAAGAERFEAHRSRLLGLAYRMLGSRAEAEDVVQDAYLRWHRTDPAEIREPAAWLNATVTRLAIDELRRQRVRREGYVGPWLPEPWVAPEEDPDTGTAEQALELADDLSVAFLLLLERLGAEERAALLLHDVFEAGYPEIADTLGKSQAAARQLVTRARRRVASERRRFTATVEDHRALVRSFHQAVAARNEAELLALFAADVELVSDGGGKVLAALRPIRGAAKVTRFFLGIARKQDAASFTYRECFVNGSPGFVARERDGELVGTFGFEVDGNHISRIFVVRNPDKLRHVAESRPA